MVVVTFLAAAPAALAQPARTPVVFENVIIFDGQSDELSGPANVFVKDGKIAGISTTEIGEDGATVIDGAGKVLMPGLMRIGGPC